MFCPNSYHGRSQISQKGVLDPGAGVFSSLANPILPKKENHENEKETGPFGSTLVSNCAFLKQRNHYSVLVREFTISICIELLG